MFAHNSNSRGSDILLWSLHVLHTCGTQDRHMGQIKIKTKSKVWQLKYFLEGWLRPMVDIGFAILIAAWNPQVDRGMVYPVQYHCYILISDSMPNTTTTQDYCSPSPERSTSHRRSTLLKHWFDYLIKKRRNPVGSLTKTLKSQTWSTEDNLDSSLKNMKISSSPVP